MPSAFFAMTWNEDEPGPAGAAADLKARLPSHLSTDELILEGPGFLLADLSEDPGKGCQLVPVLREDGRLLGAVFGTLFSNAGPQARTRHVRAISGQAAASLIRSGGRSILSDFWGSYAALLKIDGETAFIADPVSSVPCFFTEQDGVTLAFSHLERCTFLNRRRFSLNLRFISTLMAYDKIQNGETGLNEVGEILGGQRYLTGRSGARRDWLWDPREIARHRHEPPLEDAAAELRDTVQQVVRAWGSRFETIAVDLSGGLDSSIVLASLLAPAMSRAPLAIHHIMDSADPPEVTYARATAAYLGVDLAEIHFNPADGLPDRDGHPPSARPYRQYLAQGFNSRLAKATANCARTFFTGQGGDHLFLSAKSPLGFADHLLTQGIGPQTLWQLTCAARLSGCSVWQVARQAIPFVFGKTHKGAMVSGIEERRTLMNARAHDRLDPHDALPDWALCPHGLPPAKFDQVSALLHMSQVQDKLYQPDARNLVHPLMSQPLLELCLRLPVYLLCAGGVSRGLARTAFRNILPDLVRMRMTKGEATRYFVDQLTQNRALLLDTLANGELVAHGIVTRREVESFLREDQFVSHPSGRMILIYYAIEAWLRSWKRVLSGS